MPTRVVSGCVRMPPRVSSNCRQSTDHSYNNAIVTVLLFHYHSIDDRRKRYFTSVINVIYLALDRNLFDISFNHTQKLICMELIFNGGSDFKKKKNDVFSPRTRCRQTRLLQQSITHWSGGIFGLWDWSNHCCLRGYIGLIIWRTEEEGNSTLDLPFGGATAFRRPSTCFYSNNVFWKLLHSIFSIFSEFQSSYDTGISIIIRKRLKATKIEWRRSVLLRDRKKKRRNVLGT